MKKLFMLTVFLVLSSVIIGVGRTSAQEGIRLNSTPKTFQTFYAKFKRAVIRKDKKAVSALTRFPFEYGWDAGDEGTYTKAQFAENFDRIFGDTSGLFEQEDPIFFVENDTYNLTNEEDASHYIFEKKGRSYKFSAISVEP